MTTSTPPALDKKIQSLIERIRAENNLSTSGPPTNIMDTSLPTINTTPRNRPPLDFQMGSTSNNRRPQLNLPVSFQQRSIETEIDNKLREIMKISGMLTINGVRYDTKISDLDNIGVLGNGTCGIVIKMRHKPSGEIIAVKQMRRSGNSEENKRITMDIDVVLKSHDCPYIVKCLGCFITESDVWICMELMSTCFDKLLKNLKTAIPEYVLGKVTYATVKALSYLKEQHNVIHRDVKPSNILVDERGNVKLCDFGISGRLVDSMAKTKSAGCAAYMAPERIEPPNPNQPDYDIRADVWSLGITLVELATGVFPYINCKTDFEVLTKVLSEDPPSLPNDQDFSHEFREFVTYCLIKNYLDRPKYVQLLAHPFMQRHANVNNPLVHEWFEKALRQAELLGANSSARRYTPAPSNTTRHISLQQKFINDTTQYSNGERVTTNLPPNCRNYTTEKQKNYSNTFNSSNGQSFSSFQKKHDESPPDTGGGQNYSYYSKNTSSQFEPLKNQSTNPFKFDDLNVKKLNYDPNSANVRSNYEKEKNLSYDPSVRSNYEKEKNLSYNPNDPLKQLANVRQNYEKEKNLFLEINEALKQKDNINPLYNLDKNNEYLEKDRFNMSNKYETDLEKERFNLSSNKYETSLEKELFNLNKYDAELKDFSHQNLSVSNNQSYKNDDPLKMSSPYAQRKQTTTPKIEFNVGYTEACLTNPFNPPLNKTEMPYRSLSPISINSEASCSSYKSLPAEVINATTFRPGQRPNKFGYSNPTTAYMDYQNTTPTSKFYSDNYQNKVTSKYSPAPNFQLQGPINPNLTSMCSTFGTQNLVSRNSGFSSGASYSSNLGGSISLNPNLNRPTMSSSPGSYEQNFFQGSGSISLNPNLNRPPNYYGGSNYIPSTSTSSSYTNYGGGSTSLNTKWISPVPQRKHLNTLNTPISVTEPQYQVNNTSPILLQRFFHQQKQLQTQNEMEADGKKRFASHIKLQLVGDRGIRASRHQSPEPPPRLSRGNSSESGNFSQQSPLPLRRNYLDVGNASPSFSRRYIAQPPPQPPPRRTSESNSVPGSPQHFRARFHYTPEPQRRVYRNTDIS